MEEENNQFSNFEKDKKFLDLKRNKEVKRWQRKQNQKKKKRNNGVKLRENFSLSYYYEDGGDQNVV